jgi:hypothetical protein
MSQRNRKSNRKPENGNLWAYSPEQVRESQESRLRAQTIQGKRRPAPSKKEWD